jgi:two-component system cell cycle response regulator DivK
MTPAELILIVEDNPRNLKLVRDILGFNGYRTIEATTAEDAIRLARSHQPNLTLMDIQLPGMDGTEALAALRADPATRDLRVAALTAFAMKRDREYLLAQGFDGYLEKPLDLRSFPAQIAALVGARPGNDR